MRGERGERGRGGRGKRKCPPNSQCGAPNDTHLTGVSHALSPLPLSTSSLPSLPSQPLPSPFSCDGKMRLRISSGLNQKLSNISIT